MRILIYHPVCLPAVEYGGVERVVVWLARGLTQLGHQVTIACKKGSRLDIGCEVIELDDRLSTPSVVLNETEPSRWDVLHLMAPASEVDLRSWKGRYLLTVHGNGKPGEEFLKNSVFLTQNHAQRHEAEVYVHNGIDPDELIFSATKKPNMLFLSKTSWSVKNLKGAIRMCRVAKRGLEIAGGSRPYLLRMMSAFAGFRWHGPVSGIQKAELLRDASALLFPVLWPEPFGLVIVEALMSGTPVFAFDRGGISELVNNDVGRVVQSESEMIELLKRPPTIDSEMCRQYAIEKFHFLKMAKNYETLYQRVAVGGQSLHQQNPRALDWRYQK